MEKVSVIVPVYNNEKFVETCIWSLCRQTYQNLEILVINDGSSDNSGQILERMAEKDERIRLIHQKNAGVSAARNKGVELAEGGSKRAAPQRALPRASVRSLARS